MRVSAPSKVVIVGASLSGFTVADNLRREGFDGAITLIGDEPHLPYDRPPLSKQVLSGQWAAHRAELTSYEELSAAGIALRSGVAAVAVSTTARTVTLADGETVDFDVLVAATGLRPRTFGMAEPSSNVHVLRTIDDARRLQTALQGKGSLTVVGAGFLGLEIASTAAQLGVKVTVVEPQSRPLGAVLAPSMADRIGALFAEAGVDLRWACGITSISSESARLPTNRRVETTLTDGSTLTSDDVVLALGGEPALDWLVGSGIPVGDGVLCDSRLQATDSVYAVGDVASWQDSSAGQRSRVEHRTNAVEQATVVAHNIVCSPGDELSYDPVPYVWSDQLGHRIQMYGRPRSTDQIVNVDTDPAKPITIHSRNGCVVGVIGLDNAKELRRYAQLIGQPDLDGATSVVPLEEAEAK